MSSSVTILAPNGRRQNIKCTPNTTILQMIEEVCRKQGFKADEYDVKHHNKILDTSTTFRFSGLPNNAQLELVAAVRQRQDSDIILALNLENGGRVIGNFLPDDNLLHIIKTLCPDEAAANQNPVVIYTRREIYGDELKQVTLRSLGLTGGRAMIRLINRSPEALLTQANVSAPLPSKPQEEKPFRRYLKTENCGSEPLDISADTTKHVPQKNEVDLIKLAKEKRKLEANTTKIENEPESPKAKVKVEEISTPITKEQPMEVDLEVETHRIETVEDDPTVDEVIFLGSRNALLFSLETARSFQADDLPDDFFELTIDDAKKILKDIRTKRQDTENGVLMTKAMRNLEESKKQLKLLARYKKTIIRVQFPNRIVLQGNFLPGEMVNDVIEFVREFLENKSLDFHLYTTPPKCILSESSTLLEVGCVPGALLHLGSDQKEDIRLKSEVLKKITTNSMASLVAKKSRKEFTTNVAECDSEITHYSSSTDSQDVDKPGPSVQPTSYEKKTSQNSTEKVPKWFKPLNK